MGSVNRSVPGLARGQSPEQRAGGSASRAIGAQECSRFDRKHSLQPFIEKKGRFLPANFP